MGRYADLQQFRKLSFATACTEDGHFAERWRFSCFFQKRKSDSVVLNEQKENRVATSGSLLDRIVFVPSQKHNDVMSSSYHLRNSKNLTIIDADGSLPRGEWTDWWSELCARRY